MLWDYFNFPTILIGLILLLISTGGWHWFYIAAVTVPRDAVALHRYIKLLLLSRSYQRKNLSISDMFYMNVQKHPEKICFIFEGKSWTFREVNEFANRIAHIFQNDGYKSGDIVALYMENRPEFVCIWLGLSKIGIIIPLINTNLRQKSLVHSIEVAHCNAIVYGESLESGINEISDVLPSTLKLYQLNEISGTIKSNTNIQDLQLMMVDSDIDEINYSSDNKHHNKLLYIYTSGTTGLPKAAVITSARYLFMAAAIHYLCNFKDEDVFYTPMPLYHTAAGVMSVGQALIFGSTVVIRKKFSASNYFQDCQQNNCTVAQYIGEMCRYILSTKESIADTSHKLRLIFGNGLRPQIWPQFVKRFNIPSVCEFYGATEGNANIVNIDNTIGAIGFISRIIPSVYPISIIRADPITGEPIRGPDGLCQKCAADEPGVFIGKIIPGNPSRAFLGYVDQKASDKKVVHDVFSKGDSAFLSGDIIVTDARGNLYFKDRTGDTFRWKGENVSTSEVEAQVSNVAGYRDSIVYGVEIPDMEGRAGMSAILDVDQTLDLTELARELKGILPPYARPLFIRLLNSVDLTGTFKLKKVDLQMDGFNPNTITDRLYYMSSKGNYEILDKHIYERICKGEIRF